MKLSEQLRDVSAKATGGEWCIYSEPDVGLPPSLFAGSRGPTYPGFAPLEPLSYADMHFIALMCSESNRNRIIAALEAYERGPTPEQVREACAKEMDSMQRDALGCREADLTYEAHAYGFAAKAIRALDLTKIGGE